MADESKNSKNMVSLAVESPKMGKIMFRSGATSRK